MKKTKKIKASKKRFDAVKNNLIINSQKNRDKNLQDDWLPDAIRRPEASSKELTEYGGNLKEVETLSNLENN